MRKYIRDNQRLLTTSLIVSAIMAGKIGVTMYVSQPTPAARTLVAIGALVIAIVLLINLYVAVIAMLKQMQLGFRRLGLLVMPVALAGATCLNLVKLERDDYDGYSMGWRGHGDVLPWLAEGLFWSLVFTSIFGVGYVLIVTAGVWVADGFKRSDGTY